MIQNFLFSRQLVIKIAVVNKIHFHHVYIVNIVILN